MPASPVPADRPAPAPADTGPLRVVVAGSGWRFLSGISYYTCRLSNALHQRYDVGVILMRQLLPTRLYPGRGRVGRRLSDLAYADGIPVFDGVDWWGMPSLIRAVRFLRRQRPDVLVLQWWTGTVLHSYLVLCLAARLAGIRVVVEFHEVQDTGEARHRWAARYVRALINPLLRRTDGVIVHSRFDQAVLRQTYALAGVAQEIALHGPFDHHERALPATRRPGFSVPSVGPGIGSSTAPEGPGFTVPSVGPGIGLSTAGDGTCRLLFFGTIRPYKGLEDLIEAFARLPENYRLTVVGETWEGWTRPAGLIAGSPAAGRITFVNRYVADAEVDEFFAAADLVVLPYRRSSASGPLHIAMSHGLPVVVTAVGGLVEAAERYTGTTFAPAGSPDALAAAIQEATAKTGRRHTDPSSWEESVAAYGRLFAKIGLPDSTAQEPVITTSSNQTVPLFAPDLT